MIERSDGEKPGRSGPGVHLPPPLVYLGAILLGVAVDRFIPLRVLPGVIASWVGGALVLSAVILNGLGMREFRRAGTSVRPDRRAPRGRRTSARRPTRTHQAAGLWTPWLHRGRRVSRRDHAGAIWPEAYGRTEPRACRRPQIWRALVRLQAS